MGVAELWAWLATRVCVVCVCVGVMERISVMAGKEGLKLSEEDIRKESEHFEAVVNAFVNYRWEYSTVDCCFQVSVPAIFLKDLMQKSG